MVGERLPQAEEPYKESPALGSLRDTTLGVKESWGRGGEQLHFLLSDYGNHLASVSTPVAWS